MIADEQPPRSDAVPAVSQIHRYETTPDAEPHRDSNATFFCVAGVTLLAALWFAKIVGSHYSDADGFLAHVCAIAGFEHGSALRTYGELAAYYRASHAGWFPLGHLPLALWLVAWPLPLVKVPQYALILMNFATFAYVVRTMFRSSSDAYLAAALALCAWQLRAPHDPVIGTSFVTPWSAELVLLAFAGWMRYRDGGNRLVLTATYGVLAAALLTTPLAWGFAAVLIVVMLVDRSRRPAAIGVGALLVLVVGAGCVLGLPDLPWAHSGDYAASVLAQAVAALPTSYRALGFLPVGHVASLWHGLRYSDDRFVFVPPVSFWAWLPVVSCAVVAFIATLVPRERDLTRTTAEIAAFGLGLWLVPAFWLAPERHWGHGLAMGQAYDGVYFEYFGVAVLATLALDRIRSYPGTTVARLAPSLVALTVFLTCFGNVRADALALQRSQRVDDARSLLERAGSAGFFAVLPEGSTLVLSPALPFANGLHANVSDARYAIYHYSGRRYAVLSQNALGRPFAKSAWLLETSRSSGMFVSLVHYAGTSGRTVLGDRAYGYTVFPDVPSTPIGNERDVFLTTRALRDGHVVAARRRCGSVPVAGVFEAARPTLAWNSGFSRLGPVGYDVQGVPGEMTPWGAGYAATGSPKVLMSSRGSLVIVPTACPRGFVQFTGDFVAGASSTLTIAARRHVDRVALTAAPTTVRLRYPVRAGRPLEIRFATDGPAADFNPLLFRYERDVPRTVRLLVQPSDVSEELSPPKVARRNVRTRRH